MSTPKEPAYRKRVGYQAMLLGGFSTLAATLLVIGNLATHEVIEVRQKEDLLLSLGQVIPAEHYDNDLLEHPLTISDEQRAESVLVYRGILKDQVNALAWEISEPGYAGEIRLIMGVDAGGNILGVRVLSHVETPGLGDKIEVEKDDWILAFSGLSLENPLPKRWFVKKDGGQFDAFSGATITPRAVVKAIKEGLLFFQQHKTELLSPPSVSTLEQ